MKLSAKEKRIIEEFKKKIEETFPGELASVTVFGSKARGDATKESDLDLLVVIHSEDWKLGDRIRDLGYALELKYGIVLSIQIMSPKHIEKLKKVRSQFFKEVEQEGIVV